MNMDDLYAWMIKVGIFAASVAFVDIGGRALRRYFINKGREEAFAEIENLEGLRDAVYVSRSEDGQRATISCNGRSYYIKLEEVPKKK